MPEEFRSRERFSNRVGDYAKFRPSYPAEVLEFAREKLGLVSSDVVADVGSGTGIFSELLLAHGNRVLAVEPNEKMRLAAERSLGSSPRFRSVNGNAEATTLPDQSIDVVTCAQAFHWFDLSRTRDEFIRILKPPGLVLIVWNDRKPTGSPFLEAYERFLQSDLTDFRQVGQHTEQVIQRLGGFFKPGTMQQAVFPSQQLFDRDGLMGRALSSSFVPAAGDPRHQQVIDELNRIFDAHNVNGHVVMEYETKVFAGYVWSV
ncbi:class I SAM-dependent methyltransferase [Planctomicrobium sp. SH661]|uniref:class I SAM-dependent methyltransferase n=1 Tax=Planctomicrobium sp. SH661 TaxID=3448124 RepID=UPI003F5B6D33